MTRLIPLALLALSALPAHARDLDANGPDIPVMQVVEGEGIEYTGETISRSTYANDAKYAFGMVEIYGYPKIIYVKDGQSYGLPTTASLEQIDKHFGGDGVVPPHDSTAASLPKAQNPEVALPPARDGAIDLDDVAKEDGPIQIFEDSEIGAITPADGTWIAQIDSVTATGCPPGVEAAGAGAVGMTTPRDVTFTTPWWQPSDLSADFGQYTWRPVGANGYFSTPFSTGAAAQGSGMSLTVTMALDAKTASRIAVWARVDVSLSENLAAITGMSTNCQAVVTGHYVKN